MFIEADIYKKIVDNVIIVCVDLLCINNNGEILLGLRNNPPLKNVYYLPGGRIFKYENSLDAAKRKASDELGIDIDVKKLKFLGVYDDIFPSDSFFPGGGSHYTSRTYVYPLSEREETQLCTNDAQHKNLKFFNLKDSSLHSMLHDRLNDLQNKRFT